MTGRVALAAGLLVLAGCAGHAPLPMLGAVPDFELMDQSGAKFQGLSLRGHIWIADFIYTNCPGPCPLMSQRMKRIQSRTPPSIRLVSFSIDPTRDTPPVLNAYAHHVGASQDRWTFLTGDIKTLEMLDRDAFKLGDIDVSLNHSTRFVLVDREGTIRGYYGMSEEKMIEHIVSDAEYLAKEKS